MEATGLELRKCKNCFAEVSSEARTCPQCGQADPSSEGVERRLNQLLEELLDGNKSIEAVKLFREVTGCGLAEAKYYVEALQKRKR